MFTGNLLTGTHVVSNDQHSRRSIVKKLGTVGVGAVGVVAGSSGAAADHCDGSLPCHPEDLWSLGDETNTFAGTFTQTALQGTTIAYYGSEEASNPNYYKPTFQVTTAAELQASDGGNPGSIMNQYAWMSGERDNVDFNWNPRPGITLHTHPNSGSKQEEALVWTAIESAISGDWAASVSADASASISGSIGANWYSASLSDVALTLRNCSGDRFGAVTAFGSPLPLAPAHSLWSSAPLTSFAPPAVLTS